jgi:hypothetical protein
VIRFFSPSLKISLSHYYTHFDLLHLTIFASWALSSAACPLHLLSVFSHHPAFPLSSTPPGLKTEIVYDLKAAKKILSFGEDKGRTLEETIMLPAWESAASLESANGKLWRDLRASFDHHHRHLPPAASLEEVFLNLDVRSVLAPTSAAGEAQGSAAPDANMRSPRTLVDSPGVTRLTLAGFGQWLFAAPMATEDVECLYQTSVAIRREVAMRGYGDSGAKQRGYDTVIRLLEASAYDPPPGRQWREREAYSAVLQPYIISPAVNVIDIFIALEALCDLPAQARRWVQQGYAASREDIQAHLLETMRLKHPFPVLERLHGRTQYFVPLDSLFREGTPAGRFSPGDWQGPGGTLAHPADFVPFGIGPRRCPGRQIALGALGALLYNLVSSPEFDFQPTANHRYSGRVHDDAPSPFTESLHTFWRIVSALWTYGTSPRRTVL